MDKQAHPFGEARLDAMIEPYTRQIRLTIRLDTDTLDWFRNQVFENGGGNIQNLINQALREHIQYRDILAALRS